MVCAIAAFAFIGSSAWAGLVVLDQEQPYQNYSYNIGDTTVMAQTFTAGLSGTLDHIEIGVPEIGYDPEIAPSGYIYQGQPGALTTVLLNLSAPVYDAVSGNWWIRGDPAADISVTAGTMYSIELRGQSGTAVQVGDTANELYLNEGDPLYPDYLGGELWTYDYDETLTWLDDPGLYDMQFRTYIVTEVVPLPAGVWLGICAVGVAGWHLKRQRG